MTINTPFLSVKDGAQVTVRNDGTGNAGTLTLNANATYVNSGGGITASTQQGSGGNINLNLRDSLLLRQGSRLSAEAGGSGDGGNIVLNVPVLVALENSDIIANAVRGTGGNIQINTQGILGTEFRNQLTPESDITASSQFGVSGTVEITNLQVDPSSGITALPEEVADSSEQISAACATSQANQFIATGRGGLPSDPTRRLATNRPWIDLRDSLDLNPPTSTATLSAAIDFADRDLADRELRNRKPAGVEAYLLEEMEEIVEATAWTLNEKGEIALTALEEN